MKRNSWLALVVAGFFVVAMSAWYYWSPPVLEQTSGKNIAIQQVRTPGQSLPELFGKVEKESATYEKGPLKFLIRCLQPDSQVPESAQNAWERKNGQLNWVWFSDTTPVRNRDGHSGKIAIGQTISAWCGPEVMTTYPAQWVAEFIVIETGGK